ncbi:diaminopimelate decarboxylase [bacterium]|nr:diaminopimelate decarboxylase [bacterium]
MVRYRNRKLFVEDLAVERIAESVGTPAYVYSKKQLLAGYGAYRKAFRGIPHLICYALKANSNLAFLKLLARQGSGADIVSGGELYRALKAGFPPERIVFAGVGKTTEEIEAALRKKILAIHVESKQELYLIDSIAGRLGRMAPISLRINPDIDPRTHPYISTGLRKHKFGIPIRDAFALYSRARQMGNLRIEGMHIHLGSQISEVKPFEDAARKSLDLIDQLQNQGIQMNHLDIGGGLGVAYEKAESEGDPSKLASVLRPLLTGRKIQLILEPGRSIVAPAGLLLTKVLYTKENDRKRFLIVDAGMNDFIRPTLYDAYHTILPAIRAKRESSSFDVVGPVCESGDFFAKDRILQESVPGELLAILHAGAYGFSMSSNYNSRRRPPEVLVDGSRFYIIRRRESYQDLVRQEL